MRAEPCELCSTVPFPEQYIIVGCMNKSANEFTVPGVNFPLFPSPLVHLEHWEASAESRLELC